MIEAMRGFIFDSVRKCTHGYGDNDALIFRSGPCCFIMTHRQDCCEHVYLEDVAGDLQDLVGTPIVEAYMASGMPKPDSPEYAESETWTFYVLRTIKGTVTLRWYGSSNGYYSESVDVLFGYGETFNAWDWAYRDGVLTNSGYCDKAAVVADYVRSTFGIAVSCTAA